MFRKSAFAVLCAFLLAFLPVTRSAQAQHISRDKQAITINYADEVWELVWTNPPQPVCSVNELEISFTCPCSGIAYGEYGDLWLVRKRQGLEVERLDLRPFFPEDSGFPLIEGGVRGAYLSRWPVVGSDIDRITSQDAFLSADIQKRAQVDVIQLADYDRDGAVSEFLLQVGTLPCGKRQFVAVGVSARDSKLHVFKSAATNRPLQLPLQAWEAMKAGSSDVTVEAWACDDHGSERRTELKLSARNGVIRVKSRSFSCPPNGASAELLEEIEW